VRKTPKEKKASRERPESPQQKNRLHVLLSKVGQEDMKKGKKLKKEENSTTSPTKVSRLKIRFLSSK